MELSKDMRTEINRFISLVDQSQNINEILDSLYNYQIWKIEESYAKSISVSGLYIYKEKAIAITESAFCDKYKAWSVLSHEFGHLLQTEIIYPNKEVSRRNGNTRLSEELYFEREADLVSLIVMNHFFPDREQDNLKNCFYLTKDKRGFLRNYYKNYFEDDLK